MSPEDLARLGEAAAEAVREASGKLRLVDCAEVLEALKAEGCFAQESAEGHFTEGGAEGQFVEESPMSLEEARALLPGLLAAHPALAVLESRTGRTLYHAPEQLSRTYARILDRKDSPLLLVAEEIRANSRDYPRPVPLELFEGPPFNLAPGDIASILEAMAASPEHQDIRSVATDAGAVYLYSTRHMEHGYAAFLAQRTESLTSAP